MIKIVNDTIDKTIKYLQENYPRDEAVYIHIAEGFECVEDRDGNKGFGVYVPEIQSIYVAWDVPDKETTLIESIAHEYKHFMQQCDGEPYNEEAAEEFATQVVQELQSMEKLSKEVMELIDSI